MRVFITGGTGSIGREVARYFIERKHIVTILGRSEARMASAIAYLKPLGDFIWTYGDVRELTASTVKCNDLLIHCAALKHVNLCETSPAEAVDINAHGSEVVIKAAVNAGVKRVLCLSTDKACQPDSVMGMTKALVEAMVRRAPAGDTSISAVRLGNVFPSEGSVIPIWRKQLASNDPLLLTDGNMTRFFLPLANAAEFISVAAQKAKHNDIWIPRMRSVNMGELADYFAKKQKPAHAIKVIGIRPGEKLHEYLISDEEATRIDEKQFWYILKPERLHNQQLYANVRSDKCVMFRDEMEEMFG